MKVEQIYTGCLAHAAYYVESAGEAAIFDPLREVQPYIDRATRTGAAIKYVFETHFHADFVSGHLDLKAKTGAQIVFGPTAKPGYDALVADDGQEFKVGGATIKVLHTPGHTMESTTYLLIGEDGNQHGIITGDTLFIGDVGRPDLAQHVVADLTQDKLARLLYRSLREKIMPLPDHLIVYPNHGAGSACGKKMSTETTDTLGHQKETNYALRADMTEDEFVKELLTGLTTPPAYFPKNVLMNLKGYESFDTVIARGSQPLSPDAFETAANETQALILDTRSPQEFAKGFIPKAINIGVDGNFAPWVGALISDISQPILIVTDPGREQEVITRISRVGYDHTIGYLQGGFKAWLDAGKETDTIQSVSADDLANEKNPLILDVRRQSEFDSQHVEGAENVPLDYINNHLVEIDPGKTYFVHCAGGYRSMIFTSILRARGYRNLIDVKGGFKDIAATNRFKITDYVCPTTLL